MAQRITMNISLSSRHKAFVKSLVASGRYRNDSEVLREGLRLLEDRDRLRRLEERLLEGIGGEEGLELDERFWAGLRRRVTEHARAQHADEA